MAAAGLMKEVETVNQHAAVMKRTTAVGTASGRPRSVARIVTTSPKVAKPSESHCAGLLRRRVGIFSVPTSTALVALAKSDQRFPKALALVSPDQRRT